MLYNVTQDVEYLNMVEDLPTGQKDETAEGEGEAEEAGDIGDTGDHGEAGAEEADDATVVTATAGSPDGQAEKIGPSKATKRATAQAAGILERTSGASPSSKQSRSSNNNLQQRQTASRKSKAASTEETAGCPPRLVDVTAEELLHESTLFSPPMDATHKDDGDSPSTPVKKRNRLIVIGRDARDATEASAQFDLALMDMDSEVIDVENLSLSKRQLLLCHQVQRQVMEAQAKGTEVGRTLRRRINLPRYLAEDRGFVVEITG